MGHVIDVLRGSKKERIIQLGHNRLSTYGIGADRSQEYWMALLRHLVHRGFLEQDVLDLHIDGERLRGYRTPDAKSVWMWNRSASWPTLSGSPSSTSRSPSGRNWERCPFHAGWTVSSGFGL